QNKDKNSLNGLKEDKETTCRAIRYSFADIGDIVRGIDLWDKNSDAETLQGHLKKIFGHIHKSHKKKYTTDKETTKPPYKQLRKDWWEANRETVWKAMQCHTRDMNCESGTPYDDYIPQRLRWMTEWAEWFCKAQTEAYGKLMGACGNCKDKIKSDKSCTSDEADCENCEKACTEYKNKIETWKQQWDKMQMKYEPLYSQAKNPYPGAAFGGADNQQMVDFLSKLHAASVAASGKDVKITGVTAASPITPYETIAGYIHQELPITGCLEQKEFCDKKNGVKPTPGGAKVNTNEKYAFKKPPPQYKDACDCKAPQQEGACRSATITPDGPPAESTSDSEHDNHDESGDDSDEEEDEKAKEPQEDNNTVDQGEGPQDKGKLPCEIVEELFKKTENLTQACQQKYQNGKERLTQWKCIPTTSGSNTTGEGSEGGTESDVPANRRRRQAPSTPSDPNGKDKGAICIPPRRRRLYIGPLSRWAKTQTDKSQGEGSKTVEGQESVSESSGSGSSGQGAHTEPAAKVTQTEVSGQSTPSTSQSPSDLLTAFVESAAVETFFLWHQYKQLHKTEDGDGLVGTYIGGVAQIKPVSQLEGGRAGPQGIRGPGVIPPVLGPRAPRAPRAGLLGQQDKSSSWAGSGAVSHLGGPGSRDDDSSQPSSQGVFDGRLSGRGPQTLPKVPGVGDGEEEDEENPDTDPETSLKKGKIPDEFLRQMFYTLGDYKDILFSGSKDEKSSTYNDILKGDKEIQQREKDIKNAIQKYFQNSVTSPSTGGTLPSTSVTTPSNSVKQTPQTSGTTPSSWWSNNAESIWNGMICALTYKENDTDTGPMTTEGEKTNTQITQIENSQALLAKLDKEKGGEYHYENVKLEDTSGDTQARAKYDSASGDKTPLTEFVERPPYFRYLEEWGTEFCVKRKDMLEKIKEDCTEDDRDGKLKQKYSGDGESCETILSQKYDILPSLSSSCPTSCSSYRRWIGRKRTEYDKQQNAYCDQKTKCKEGSDKAESGNEFCGTVQSLSDAAAFLQKLGACKNNDSESGQGTLDFSENGDAFKDADNCKPCSQFKINCDKGNCDNSNGNNCNGKNKKDITPSDIKNSTDELDMVVSDSGKNGSQNGLQDCITSGIFTGIRKDVWTCGNVCGYNVCKPKNVNGKKGDGKQIIFIRAFFKRWLEYFLQDYNKIRKKLKPCMNNSDGSTCINDYDKTYNCVDEWIKLKMAEWKKIKKHYLDKNPEGDTEMISLVSNFLGEVQPQTDVTKAIKPCTLDNFEQSKYCAVDASSEKAGGKDGRSKDIVDCLLYKLQKKIDECNKNHETSGESCTGTLQQTPPLPDEEETEEENPENKVEKPAICGNIPTTEDTVDEGDQCKPADEKVAENEEDGTAESGEGNSPPAPPEPAPSSETSNPEQTPVL
ncbi:erythrocyte membrane protein 1, EMP1, partial [Plasmodium reichenowi]